jgi:4-O-beta-D-mannosyl-D-glucose phosphorylase
MPETRKFRFIIYDLRIGCIRWMVVWTVLTHRAPDPAPGRSVFGYRTMWHCTHERFENIGAFGSLKTSSRNKRNVVLHPEFVNGKYAFYTHGMDLLKQEAVVELVGLSSSITNSVIEEEVILDRKIYHTISESKMEWACTNQNKLWMAT